MSRLTQTIKEVIDEKVPRTKLSLYMKRCWTDELTQRHKEVHRLAWQAYKKRAVPWDLVHQIHKACRNTYSCVIEQAKRAHWEDFLATLNDRSVWTAHKYVSGEPMDVVGSRCPC